MLSDAPQSPKSRNVPALQDRVARLEAYEQWRTPVRIDLAAIVGTEDYEAYWRELDRVITEVETSQAMSDKLRATIAAASDKWQVRESASPSD